MNKKPVKGFRWISSIPGPMAVAEKVADWGNCLVIIEAGCIRRLFYEVADTSKLALGHIYRYITQ